MIGKSLILATLTLLVPNVQKAWSYGSHGHQIICNIAFQALEPDEQKTLMQFVQNYKGREKYNNIKPWSRKYFAHSCMFADQVKSLEPELQERHYINMPTRLTIISRPNIENNQHNLLEAISCHWRQFILSNNSKEKTEALFFLSHWIGDIHQPLHVSYGHDRGGNEIATSGIYNDMNMHKVWDSGIIGKWLGRKKYYTYSNKLYQQIPEQDKTNWTRGLDELADLDKQAVKWAQGSYDIARADAVCYADKNKHGEMCKQWWKSANIRHFTQSYQDANAEISQTLLKQGGIRLAAILKLLLQAQGATGIVKGYSCYN